MEVLEQRAYFYDPHPGLAGAIIPIPDAVKKEADALDGQTRRLRDVLLILKSAARASGGAEVTICENYIKMEQKVGDFTHSWRVIRYRAPD